MARRTARILVVDDSRMDVELTLSAFRDTGLPHIMHVAYNGQMALDFVSGHGPYADRNRFPLPDLVLLDLKMPGMDGHMVLRQLKALPVVRRVPVIILSSSLEESDRTASYDLGANGFMVKPTSYEGFLEAVRILDAYWFGLNVGPF